MATSICVFAGFGAHPPFSQLNGPWYIRDHYGQNILEHEHYMLTETEDNTRTNNSVLQRYAQTSCINYM